MKINQPVTDHQRHMKPGSALISRTDLKGIITYVDQNFIDICGYSEDELMRKNHNIVRHPDMPPAAFQNLWDTIKAGQPWNGIVKNRAKNGDFYWVEANVAPVTRNGQIVEYISVRKEPSPEQISAAENLYRQLNSGSASLELSGIKKWLHQLHVFFNIRNQIIAGFSLIILLMLSSAFLEYANSPDPSGLLIHTGIGIGISLAFAIMLLRNVVSPMKQTASLINQLQEDPIHTDIDIHRPDEIGDIQRAFKAVQIKISYDIMAAREEAERAGRIQQSLDNVTSNVMIADQDYNITYMNQSAIALFKNAEEDLKKDLPNFNSDTLLGSNIDIFHKDPSHQRQLLSQLTDTYVSDIQVGGRHLRVIANPVMDSNGKRRGTVVEWQDRTNEVAVEKEVEHIVMAAQSGDLSQQIDIQGKEGFFRQLSEGINQLIQVVQGVFSDVAEVMEAMSQGDLTRKITQEYNGSYGEVKDHINATTAQLQTIVRQIRESAEFIRNASEEISAGNNNLSQRAETQASTLEQTASSMEQLTSTVKNNADNAQQANQLAQTARQTAEKGGHVVQEAVAAMDEISHSSKQIADIIGVIDEIAFQTNLLALNASVEAARAGEQGRGFAVVATEVRNLAQRSASAAKEIKDLISDSVHKVSTGEELVSRSGETLSEIMEGVKKVGDIISDIASASQEQSAGIEEVNRAVTQMDEITQQNAALAEQASAASESSLQKATEMNRMVNFFKI